MASPAQQIVQSQQLGAAAGLLYTSPSLVWTQITALTVSNPTPSPHVVSLWIVPNGSSAGSNTVSTPPRAILAGGTYNGSNESGMILGPGDALWGAADAINSLTIMAAGLLIVS